MKTTKSPKNIRSKTSRTKRGHKTLGVFILLSLLILLGLLAYGGYTYYGYVKSSKEEAKAKVAYYQALAKQEHQWIRENQAPNGALLFYKEATGTSTVVPYFSNLAAIALLGTTYEESNKKVVQDYMDWYFSHLNTALDDPTNGAGSIYDYQILMVNNQITKEINKKKYDSVDAYAATCLMLLRAYYQATGDDLYLTTNSGKFTKILQAMLNTLDQDHLAMTNNSNRIKYTMDNVEVNQGLRDAIALLDEVYLKDNPSSKLLEKIRDDSEKALKDNTLAIEKNLWNQQEQRYEVGLDKNNERLTYEGWNIFYPDAVVQLFPMAFEVSKLGSSRASMLYASFNNAFSWETMDHIEAGDTTFYWCILAYVGAIMGDETRVETFLKEYQKLTANGHEYPLYIADAGWVIRACDQMIGHYEEKMMILDPFNWVGSGQ